MKREILFRGKRLDKKKWVYGNLMIRGEKTVMRDFQLISGYYEVDPDTVGQFTGMEDKNGNKIFEGDLITNSLGYNYTVEFENGSFQLYHTKLKDWNQKPMRWGLLSRAFEIEERFLIEVIGNIHDNPELLK